MLGSTPRRRIATATLIVLTASIVVVSRGPSAVGGTSGYSGVSSRLQNLTQTTSTAAEHAAHPALALVSAMVPWRHLEPTDQSFDWSTMDANVADARTHGYRLIVRIMAGRAVPSWLLTNHGGPSPSIRLLGTDQNAADYCSWIDVPLPWDQALRAEYVELMQELGRWLRESDGEGGTKGDHVFLVPVAMPSILGTEMVAGYGANVVCPSGRPGEGLNLQDTNRAAWDAVSTQTERRAWVEAAWRDAIGIHMQELPADTGSVIAFGTIFNDQHAASLRVAQLDVAAHPSRLWSMYTNLQPLVRSDGTFGPWRSWCPRCHDVLVAARASGGAVGFQTAAGAANNTIEKFRTAADDALATYDMRFLETQPINVDRYGEYLLTGADPLQRRMQDALLPRGTDTAVACDDTAVGVPTACTATVTDTSSGMAVAPQGSVRWSTGASGTFSAVTCTLGPVSATSAGCSTTYTPSATGAHPITATYEGSADHLGSASSPFTVTVAGSGSGDLTAPTVIITAPADGTTVRKNSRTSVTATASDDVAIDRVVFTVNGTTLCTQRSSPYTCRWLVPKKANVVYTLGATAYDRAGNQASHTITVTSR